MKLMGFIQDLASRNFFWKVSVLVAYVVMMVVNFMANSLPINNRSTGEISADYANLFAPAGYVFSIWGLIYSLLACFVVLFLWYIKNSKDGLYYTLKDWFLLSCVLNVSWIFAWHYDWIWLSVLIMIGFVYVLFRINKIVRSYTLDRSEQIFVSTPFSIYFGG